MRVRTAPWFLGRGGGETAVLGLLCGPARGRWPRVGFGFCRTRSTRLNFLFTPAAVSAACGDEPLDLAGLSVFAGLDLSESADLTALVLVHCDPRDGVRHLRPFFWLPAGRRLAEKAARDHAPYDLWAEQGHLETTPGAAIGYEFVAERLKEIFEDYQVTKIAFDLWNWTHLRPWLSKAGFSEHVLDTVFVPFGQGYRSMSPAVRDLETLVSERKLRHGGHPVLTMCMANTTIERGDAGNRKLSKKRSMGRIDGAVALVMAIAAAPAAWTAKVDIAALIG